MRLPAVAIPTPEPATGFRKSAECEAFPPDPIRARFYRTPCSGRTRSTAQACRRRRSGDRESKVVTEAGPAPSFVPGRQCVHPKSPHWRPPIQVAHPGGSSIDWNFGKPLPGNRAGNASGKRFRRPMVGVAPAPKTRLRAHGARESPPRWAAVGRAFRVAKRTLDRGERAGIGVVPLRSARNVPSACF
jgi:hypothetical protein